MNHHAKKEFIGFTTKFILLFLFFYGFTILIISLAAPGGIYSSFIQNYFDYVSWIKITLMKGASFIAKLFGYSTHFETGYLVRIKNGRGVYIAYDCVGYGVYSFWSAFVLATATSFFKKLYWLIGGLFLLWIINVIRIGLFLVAINKGWKMPLGIGHHTWYNIFAYTSILIMMYIFNLNTLTKRKNENSFKSV
jgi:exosortase/archaeosortase family protein